MRRTIVRPLVLRQHRCGVVTVEVALTIPVFVMFLAAVLEFGHFYLVSHMLCAAARHGAHLGSYEGTTAQEVQAYVKEIVGATINSSQATVIVKDGSVFDSPNVTVGSIDYNALGDINLAAAETGDCFIVQVSVPYDNVSVLPPYWIKGHKVTGRAVMRHE